MTSLSLKSEAFYVISAHSSYLGDSGIKMGESVYEVTIPAFAVKWSSAVEMFASNRMRLQQK